MEVTRKKNRKSNDPIWYDNLFCFDIETTSVFITPDGKPMLYDYDLPESFYKDCEKVGIMYHWQFGIEYDEGMHVIAGRTWEEFIDFISELNEHFPHNKICWCHNFGMEFHFLLNVLAFDDVFARRPHKVLTADTGNLHFRCSYFLVNKSLAKWAETRNLSVKKLVGDLDYNAVMRTPLTPLTDAEKNYMKNDILVMFEGLKLYRDKYKNVYRIPLTQTGEIRLVLQEKTSKEYALKEMNKKLIPPTKSDYDFYMLAFGGGDVHANQFYADRLLHNVMSADIASSYPWACLSGRFMCAPPVPVENRREQFFYDKAFAYFIYFEAFNIVSRLCNTFLSFSRCELVTGYRLDNGRVLHAEYVRACMYCYDFEMFSEFYDIERLNILEMRVAPVRPMNDAIRRYIVDLYEDKTCLPNDDEHRDERNFVKQCVNGIYGDMVQRQFEDTFIFNNGNFKPEHVTEEKYLELYNEKIKQGYKLYKNMLTGIAIPSIARRNLWRGVIKPLDDRVVYFDTDSGKWLGNDNGVISSYNMSVLREYPRIASELHIAESRLIPSDPKGKLHPIGCFEFEPHRITGYSELKTLGAKKYALKDYDPDKKTDVIKITIAGVPKQNAVKLKNVDDLSEDLEFTPKECGKNLLFYSNDQPEVVFPDGFVSRERFGICFQPSGYKLGLSADYASLLKENNGLIHDREYDKIFQTTEREDILP